MPERLRELVEGRRIIIIYYPSWYEKEKRTPEGFARWARSLESLLRKIGFYSVRVLRAPAPEFRTPWGDFHWGFALIDEDFGVCMDRFQGFDRLVMNAAIAAGVWPDGDPEDPTPFMGDDPTVASIIEEWPCTRRYLEAKKSGRLPEHVARAIDEQRRMWEEWKRRLEEEKRRAGIDESLVQPLPAKSPEESERELRELLERVRRTLSQPYGGEPPDDARGGGQTRGRRWGGG